MPAMPLCPMKRLWSGYRRAGWDKPPRLRRSWRSSPPTMRAMSRALPTRWTAAASRVSKFAPLKPSLQGPMMPVTLDPDAAAVFKAFREADRPPYETVSPAEAREFYLKGRWARNPEPPELKSVDPLAIPAPHGAIPARKYTPKVLRTAGGLAPCLIFFDGGGWVIGDLDSHDVVCRKLADEAQLMVISVDYRLPPPPKLSAGGGDGGGGAKW